MQIVFLATDEQQKLSPLSTTFPGPLLPIIDRPVIEANIEIVARAGYKDILMCLYNRGGQIAAHVGDGRRWGVHIEYAIQREAMGSAGSLKWVGQVLKETFLVLPADTIIDLDIEAALNFHQSHQGVATAILHSPRDSHVGQHMRVDHNGRVLEITTNKEADALAQTGAFIFEPSVLKLIASRSNADCGGHLIPALIQAGADVYGFEMSGYWNSLDTFQAYHEAQQVFLYSAYTPNNTQRPTNDTGCRVRYPSIAGRQVVPGIWVGKNALIHPSAQLAAPVYVGENSWIDSNVELGPAAVVGSNVIVDDGATVDQSILLDRTYVGHLVNIKEAVVHGATIINSASAEHTHVTDSFLLSRIEATTAPPGRTWQVLNQACALFLIIAVLPLILPLALAVYITSGFRLLHRSAHLGKILKNAEGNGDKELSFETFDLFSFQTRQRNGAYTILGGWMEALDLHRLPELLNVLRGDIHMIGVKPLMPNDTSYLMEEWHQRRNECVPGFTGLWYIQTDPGSDFDTILVNDVYYSATRTWQGDIRILFRTPGAWLRRYRLSSQAKRTPAQDHSTQTHTTLSSKN